MTGNLKRKELIKRYKFVLCVNKRSFYDFIDSYLNSEWLKVNKSEFENPL